MLPVDFKPGDFLNRWIRHLNRRSLFHKPVGRPAKDVRRYARDRFVFVKFIGRHHSFITSLLEELDIEKIITYPIVPADLNSCPESVFPKRIYMNGVTLATYTFVDRSSRNPVEQDISFYCNPEQLKKMQTRVAEYSELI
jgi:hypothetical protein